MTSQEQRLSQVETPVEQYVKSADLFNGGQAATAASRTRIVAAMRALASPLHVALLGRYGDTHRPLVPNHVCLYRGSTGDLSLVIAV